MDNKEVIQKFYSAFKEGDSESMIKLYDDDIIFTDPAFGTLKGENAKAMWKMLLSNKDNKAQVTFSNISSTENSGNASWTASYNYGPKSRKVVNHVNAKFEFKNGKISKHTDDFNLWKWTQQALGTSGYLLGWSSFMKKKIQAETCLLYTSPSPRDS